MSVAAVMHATRLLQSCCSDVAVMLQWCCSDVAVPCRALLLRVAVCRCCMTAPCRNVYTFLCVSVSVCVNRYTERRRPVGCRKLQVIFRKRATNHRALLKKMTYRDKTTYDSSQPCTANCRYDGTQSWDYFQNFVNILEFCPLDAQVLCEMTEMLTFENFYRVSRQSLWAALPSSTREILKIQLHTKCTIWNDCGDDFLRIFLEFSKTSPLLNVVSKCTISITFENSYLCNPPPPPTMRRARWEKKSTLAEVILCSKSKSKLTFMHMIHSYVCHEYVNMSI